MFIRFCSRLSVLLFCLTGLTSAFAAAPALELKRVIGTTGSIILFEDKVLAGPVVQTITKDRWTHSGILVFLQDDYSGSGDIPQVAPQGEGKPYCFEAVIPAVRLIPFDTLRTYTGCIALRKCETPLQPDDVHAFLKDYNGRTYEEVLPEILKAVNGKNKQDNTKSVFCSELVGLFLQRVKLLKEGTPEYTRLYANNMLPGSFASEEGLLSPQLFGPEQFFQNYATRTSCCPCCDSQDYNYGQSCCVGLKWFLCCFGHCCQ